MLTIKHIETAQDKQDLFGLYKKWSAPTGINATEETFEDFFNYYKNETHFVAAYKGKDIVSAMRFYKWTAVPYYCVNSFIMLPYTYHRLEFDKDHPYTLIMNNILETMESQGYYTWYRSFIKIRSTSMIPNSPNDLLYNSFYGYDSDKEQLRYNFFCEEVIEPGSSSSHSAFDWLIFSKIWKVPIHIVKFTLKPEYRKLGDVINNEDKFYNGS